MVSTSQLFFLLLIPHHYATAQTVALFRSGPLCPEQMVTYYCNVTQGRALHWIIEPFISSNDDIRFLATTPRGTSVGCNDVAAVNCTDLDFMATLTNLTNPTTIQGVMLYDMEATMTFTATTRLNGRVLQCIGSVAHGIINISNTTLDFSAPCPPHTPTSTVQQYGWNSVNLTVQWQPPQCDSMAPVNYNITVSPDLSPDLSTDLSPVTTSGTSIPVTVPYNVRHTVSIVATNCIGSSSAVMESIRIVNCSDPTVPRNGSIDPYQNTLEGAEIVFRCDQGFDPAGDMTAVCAANGSWTPDPATHMCNSTGTQVLLPIWAFVLAAIGTLVLTS